MANSNLLSRINNSLPEGWEAKLTVDHGRIYYIDHGNQVSSWVPPPDNWDPGALGLPYGWECATDKNDKPYYINHVDKYTTRDDPRDDPDYVEPPKPREIELSRDSQKGFGFVAGSEKPVVVRFVTEGGPSVDKLLPGDQIIKINGEDVKKAPRQYVIDLVRSCRETMTLTVCQPYSDNGDDQSTRKSALLTAAKKAKLKNNPSRVRFAESVTVTMVNGMQSPSPDESYVPFMPNVLKVFLENGQTKSFKYDNKTTVKDVANSLQEKLGIKSVKYFNLVLQNMKSHIPGRLTILQDHETLADIAARPGARHFRCLFRVMFVPRDAFDLLNEEPMAFEYFYMQCCNDVVQEKFPELKGETVLKLAALQIQQHAMHNNTTGKINIKAIEKECGLEKFVPSTQLESMKGKDLRKLLSQQLKVNQNLTPPGQKQLSALQAKLHYVKIVSELKTFGSRVFMVTLLDQKMEAMILVGPKAGISLITNIKHYTLSMLADFNMIEKIKVSKEKDNNMQRVEVTVKGKDAGMLNLGLLKDDVQNFVGIVEGYYRIFVDTDACLVEKPASKQTGDPDVPPYTSKHKVLTTPWSYPEDIVSQTLTEQNTDNERLIDLCQGPPAYEDDVEYINRIKAALGIKKSSELNEDEAVISLVDEQGTDLVDGTEQHINKSVIIIGKRPENNNKGIRRQGAQEGGDIPNAKKPKTSIPDIGQNGHVYLNSDIYEEIHDQKTVVNGDELSDTDSGVESERKVPLEDPPTPESGGSPGGQGDQGGSDTDSWGTSPDKVDGESFGLHSPDVLPRSESDFQAIASSFGLLSPDKIPPGIEEGILDPRMFSQRQLYIDPDIIDLTLLPPLEAPGMGNNVSHYGTWSPEMLQSHLHSMGQVDGGHPPTLARSASVGDTPDFFDEDIDSLIANLTVPPPPSSGGEGKDTQEEEGKVNTNVTIDESFADLVIPPPPGESATALQQIAIVPPIEDQTEADIKIRKRNHRRSSSLDTFLIKFPVEEGGTESSTDPPENIPPALPASSPPKLSPNRNPPNELILPSTGSPVLKDFESPASVSQRLNTLLQSMPIPGETTSHRFSRNTRRTSSLKLSRSSSADTANIVQDAIDSVNAVAVKFGRSNSFQTRHKRREVDTQGRSPTSHKNGPGVSSPGTSQNQSSRRVQRTHSFDVKANKENHDSVWSDSSGSDTNDTLASLKATLKSYRDFLLSKSKDSSRGKDSRRSSISSDDGSEKGGSSLQRSNSFTLGWLKRRSSLSGSDDKGRRSGSDLALNSKDQPIIKKDGVEGSDKKTPVLMNQLAVTRSKLKSHSAFSVQLQGLLAELESELHARVNSMEAEFLKEQKGSKKMGPMKALLTASDGQISSCDERRPLEPLRLSVYNKTDPVEITTKDDLSLSVTDTSQTKKDHTVSPFGTVGSMWRPMSMSRSSSSSDEPETHTYNNFDLLRDMSAEKTASKGRTSTKAKQAPVPVPSPLRPPRKTTPTPSVSSSVSSSLSSSPTSSVNGDVKDSLSEECYALLRENVSENHSDSVKHILKRTYSVESFTGANEDSDKLLSELKQTMETLKESRIDRQPLQFGMCKDELIGQVKLFVTDAKLLVSNATQTRDKMAKNLNKSMHTLAKIFLHCQATMLMMEAVHQAQHLGFEVIKVTNAYKSTVNAAHAAVGKPLGDPHMRYLMRQATNLATLLSNLLKTLKSLEQK